ncbi:MAG: hypothetical protein U0572_05550 [Phycisphaerales bacterium]
MRSRLVPTIVLALASIASTASTGLAAQQSAPPPQPQAASGIQRQIGGIKGDQRRVHLERLPGSIAVAVLADIDGLTIPQWNRDEIDLVGDRAVIDLAKARIDRIEAALSTSEIQQECPLRLLNAVEAANAISQNRVFAQPLPQARVIILRGQPEDVKQAVAMLQDLEMRLEDEARAKSARDLEERTVAAQKADAEAAARMLTIEFPGGTIDEYLALITKRMPNANVIMGTEVIARLKMPPVNLRSVTATAAISLLESLPLEQDGTRVSLVINHIPGDPKAEGAAASDVHILNLLAPGGEAATTREPVVMTRVFNLGALQRHDNAMLKGLLEAIAAGVELNGKSKDFATKFHEGSGLFFVRGSNADVAMVDVIVNTVMNSPKSP